MSSMVLCTAARARQCQQREMVMECPGVCDAASFAHQGSRRNTSALVRAAAGVVQPFLGLFVGPTGKREVRRGGDVRGGTDGAALVPICGRPEAMHRCSIGRSAQGDQQACGQKRSHRICSSWIEHGLSADYVWMSDRGPKPRRLHDRSNWRDLGIAPLNAASFTKPRETVPCVRVGPSRSGRR
jgi:hypothetical protein